MSGIYSYPQKSTPDGSDIVIGTSVENGQTKNFSVSALSSYAINTYLSTNSWQFITLDPDPEEMPKGTFSLPNYGGSNSAWSDVTVFRINTSMSNNTQSINYLVELIGLDIRIQDRENLDRYGVYKLNSITNVEGSIYELNLSYLKSSGTLFNLRYYGIQNDTASIISDKNFVFTQSVPSETWTIQHNLNKFPSVSVVNNNNILMYGNTTYVDQNNLIINFSAGFSGKAYLN